MNELMIFENTEFGSVRTVEIDGKTYFVASDVAKSLGYAKPQNAIAAHCKGALKRGIGVQTGNKADGTPAIQIIEMSVITEGDIYRLIIKSQLPTADKFENWIFDEVIPSIRKNGGYISGQETMTDDELLAKAILVAQNKIDERDKAISYLKTEVNVKNQMIGELKPKAEFFDAVADSKDAIEIGNVAKVLNSPGLGRNKLFDILRKKNILMKNNIPYQKFIDSGYFRTIEQKYSMPDGETRISIKTLVYQKGIDYIMKTIQV